MFRTNEPNGLLLFNGGGNPGKASHSKLFLTGPFPASFSFFVFSIQLTVNNVQYKFCGWQNLNRGPLMSEATALPTEPQPLPQSKLFKASSIFSAICKPKGGGFESWLLKKIQVILFEVKRVSQDLVTKMCFVFQEIFFLGQRVSQGLVTEMFKVWIPF